MVVQNLHRALGTSCINLHQTSVDTEAVNSRAKLGLAKKPNPHVAQGAFRESINKNALS